MVTFTNNSKIERIEISNRHYEIDSTNKEVVVILLSGSFEIGPSTFCRKNVFLGDAEGFYVANSGIFTIRAPHCAEICVIEHPSTIEVPFTQINNEDTQTKKAGQGNFERKVITVVDGSSGLKNLIIGETFKQSGNWSSWPPHKHDTYSFGEESKQKEAYLYKFGNDSGFGLQLLYDTNIDDAAIKIVKNNQEVKIEKGYHPVVASPYSEMYYLWALFGDNSFFKVNYEPEHSV